ncbi:MAG: DUF1616 domain-containing protein [Methanothrix sp.]|nr:DUF1616 domain-containing protein [Methanothrix sp.]
MRLAWPPPRHLIASVLIPLLALALANLSPESLQDILSPIALILVLLIPGYLATLYIFPGKSDLSAARRAFICLAFSAIFAGSFSFILSATPRGLQSASLATILSLLSIFLAAVTYGRWSNLPRNRRFLLMPKRGLGSDAPVSRSVLAILLLGACLMAALVFALGPNLPFQDASSNLGASTPEESLTAPSSSLEEEKVQIKSYPPEDLVTDLSQNNSSNSGNAGILPEAAAPVAANSTAINDTENSSSSTFNDLSKSADFFMGGGGGGGGGSSSSSSSQTSSKKQAEDKTKQTEKAASATASPSPTTSGATSGNVKSDTTAAASNLPNTSSSNNDNQTIKGNQTLEINQTESSNSTANTNLAESGNQTASIRPAIEESPSRAQNLTLDQAANPETGQLVTSEPLPSSQLSSSPSSTAIDANESKLANEAAASAPAEPAIIPSPETNLRESPAQPENPAEIKDSSSQAASSLVSPTVETDLSRAIRQSEIDLAELNGKEADRSNLPPVLEAITPDRPSPQLQGAAIFWKAEAKDEEGDKILYKFFLNGKEERKWSKINSWSWLTQGMPAGDYQITVLAIDGNHAGQESFDSIMNASFTISRPNQAPALQQLRPDRSSPQGKGSKITWTASANDPDNDPIYYRFLKNDVASTDWSQSGSWTWDTSSDKPGEYRITVQAKDGLHASKDSSDSSMVEKFTLTEPNGVPEVTGLKADRTSPQVAGSIITWMASAADPEGDGISYKFLLNDKETSQWSSSNSWVWNTSSAALGEYHVRVLVRDGSHSPEDSFDSYKDATMTITAADTNQPPAISSLVSDITSPDAQGVTVNWTAEAQDPDGDRILYKFQLNGRDVGRWSESADWRWSTTSLSPGDYRIRVLARDGKHAPENSFDSSREAVFSLISEIDQQINQLMNKRSSDASQKDNYQSSDIKVTSGSSTNSNAVLGKSNGTAEESGAAAPRKLG